ncbi:ABC transporter G family member 18 [Rhizoctonia solani]|uniref:ABC transporter G family member 18 n=1 Tax=Rhizoctonia solani TaxID=456999 RepID=A0A0K6FYM3_9AGAM|nr:ABC transporter G family member 18 [Rhizoctonia solani]
MATSFEFFIPLPLTYAIPDPRYAGLPNSEFLLIIPLYGAVPLGSTDPSNIVPDHYFCFLGKAYDHGYIELSTILHRLDQKVRLADYNALRANPNTRLFGFWNNKGTWVTIPTFMLVDPRSSRYTSFAAWDVAQRQRWANVCGAIEEARPSLPFNVYSRFIQPATDQITLFFTPTSDNPSDFTLDNLRRIFQKAFADANLKLPQYKYSVISLQDANSSGLILTGAHYLHFYFTWMNPNEYNNLWAVLQKRSPLTRPWPTEAVAAAIQKGIGNPPKGGEVTIARMSHFKATASIGQRPSYPDQKTVMNASATELAKEMWGARAVSSGSPADAEWLHRNAFHFGGMDDVANLASSQTRENLVFGTAECNTHMIRAENTISSLLRADARISQDDRRTGTLVTTNIFKGTISRRDLNPPGFAQETIPAWVDKEKYMWLSFGLRYQWVMPGNSLGLTFNADEVFDPFSRFIPLRVEARLDDAIMDYLYEHILTSATPSPRSNLVIAKFSSQSDLAKANFLSQPKITTENFSSEPELATESMLSQSNLTMARRIPEELSAWDNLTVPPSTSYQEPTLLWNAAKHHLPYVLVGNTKIYNPTIAEAPSEGDEPARPIVRVIGAGPLFSPVTEGAPVKAVRVVDLKFPTQRHAEIRSSAAPAHPRIQQSLLSPILADAIPESEPPQGGFVAVGDIDLFGVSSLSAKFEKWEGPAPPDVVVLPDKAAVVERVTLSEDFHLSSIITALQGTAFDIITFRNVSVYHQNYKFDATKAIGWYFSADLVIDESCAVLREVLSVVLGVSEPTVPIYLPLGLHGKWHKLPSLHSFTIQGIFAGLAVKPVNGVVLSKIGVRLFGIRTMKYDPTPRSALEFGFSVFGSMNLDVPGSTVPLSMDYDIQEQSGTICLGASVDTWKDPFGVSGLVLSGVQFSVSFALSSPWKSLNFDVSADLMYQDLSTTLQGSFSPHDAFNLKAPIRDFSVKTINTLFKLISDGELSLPEIDVSIGSANLSITSENGFKISIEKVAIGDYTSLDADLIITSHNAALHGKLTNDTVQFGDVELKEAFLQITFEKKGSEKSTDLTLEGQVAFSTLVFQAAVHLYTSPDNPKSLEWTVLASLTVQNDALPLSKVVPELHGTPFDLALTQAVFVAASKDDPSIGNMITSDFSFHQGVQICAVLSEIDSLNSLMRDPVAGLTINAGWSKEEGFDLEVNLPTPTQLNLGNGIETTPITLSIVTKPTASLTLSAGLNVPVAHSSTPLLFTLSLDANPEGADATGQMSGWWVDPLGISPKVKVGPNIGLSISIIFAQFVTTGVPSGFALQGGLMIGNTQAQLALSINEDPMKELLSAKVQSLNITDVVDFASTLTDAHIPDPPRDFLDFQDVELYICPTGVYIGTTFYPQGFSFQADVILFGKRADIKCVVDTNSVSLKGGVDNFTLGPLIVRGTTGPRAVIECELGPTDQHLLIDGVISLFALESLVHIEVDILPTPKFDWSTQLKFTDLLLFQLRATLVGSISFTDLSDADFEFDALFEQHILQYIHDQVMGQFDQARRAAKDGIATAQKDVDKAETAWKSGLDKAQKDLDAAKKNWDAKNKEITTASNKIIDAYNWEIERLQEKISSAQHTYDIAMNNAQNDVENAQRKRAQALQEAQHKVDNAMRKMDNDIDAAQRDVDRAERDFDAAFGSANAAIESARRKVQSLQNQINDVYGTIRDYENAPWYQFWKKAAIAGLYVAVGALEASKEIADGVLRAAEAVLTSTDFVTKQTAFNAAKGALDTAEKIGQAGLDMAKGALTAADKASQLALDIANKTLEATKDGVDWGVLQGAKDALQVYKDANDAAFHAATQALVDLVKSAEYLAYQTAKAGLDAARAASVSLDAVKAALKLAQEVGDEALKISQWVADHVLEAFDIRVVHLSGSLRGMVGAGGSMAKPFTAHIEGVVASHPFSLDGEFNPDKTADFITFIFKDLWNEIKKIA